MEDEGRRKKAPIRFGPKLLELLSKLGEIELEGVDIEVGELEIARAEAIKESGVEEKVKHRTLIIPGMVAHLSREIEDLTGWKVLVGPSSSAEISEFLREHWYKEKRS